MVGGGQIAAAEALLTGQSHAQPQSFAWNQDAARNLTRLTISLGADHNLTAQRAAATRALVYIIAAESAAPQASALSNLRLTEGMLQERYLANPVAAKVAYQSAVSADARNTLAAAALGRLQKIDENNNARMARKSTGG